MMTYTETQMTVWVVKFVAAAKLSTRAALAYGDYIKRVHGIDAARELIDKATPQLMK